MKGRAIRKLLVVLLPLWLVQQPLHAQETEEGEEATQQSAGGARDAGEDSEERPVGSISLLF